MSKASSPKIVLSNLSKIYPNGHVGLQPTDLELSSGQLIGIVGPNGAGKSTLIHLLAGVLRPTTGSVITSLTERRQLAWVSQFTSIDWFLTVRDNVMLGAKLGGESGNRAVQRVDEALEWLGLSQKGKLFPDQLSGGQQRRLQVARAIAQDAQILLLDEPTEGLDPVACEEVMSYLKSLSLQGRLILISSHDLSILESYVDSVLFVSAGELSLEAGKGLHVPQYSHVVVDYYGTLDEGLLDQLAVQGIECLSRKPLELKIDTCTNGLKSILRLITDAIEIHSLEVRPQTLRNRFFDRYKA